MSQSKLMRGIILSALGLALSAGFFIPFQMTHAAVLYEQSNIGTEYDVLQGATANYGYYVRIPQPPDELISTTSTITSYTGTAEWLRIKRLAGLACDAPFSVTITTPDRNTIIGIIPISSGVTNGDYCDFPITGPNRTDMAIGALFICLSGDCDNLAASFVLDGSPQNSGYVTDGTETVKQPGGWAFQICDSGGCEGGFEMATTTATSTATSTDTGTGTTTATSTATSTPPTGASSVLFLPGIQASRLYLGDGNQVFNRMWEPTNNIDVRTLGLSEQGTSNVDIRTSDVVDETSVEILGKNIYKGFIGSMNELAAEQLIKEWTPFAYDWRYDVFDIAENGTKYLDGSNKNPVDEAIRLASSSLSKKVTIIAHSNGGLLAKAIMYELEKRGKADLVDKIIFIGTPHLGTPKAIATILHGYDQEAVGGVVIDDGVARSIIKNLPGAYSLLPSEKYFDLTTEPLVQFDNSSSTVELRTAYGQSIDSVTSFNAFITGQSDTTGRAQVSETEVNKPSVANQDMFLEAQKAHKDLLDTWVPPGQTKVYQVTGTGLKTIQAIEYREVLETVCPRDVVVISMCQSVLMLKPHAVFTPYGDETVVSKSAAYVTDILNNDYFINLQKIENQRIPLIGIKKTHENITEISQVQDFLRNVIVTDSSTDVEFISEEEPNFTNIYDIEEINSPVQISATDNSGNVTGMVKEGNKWVRKEDIPDSAYIELGSTKYLIIPASIKRTTKLTGEALGGYTLSLNTLTGDTQTKRHEIVNATTTPTMVATYGKDNGSYSTIKTDYTGDGIIDYVSTVDGVYVAPTYTYNDLKNAITALPIRKSLRDVLLKMTNEAEKLSLKSNQKLYDPLEKLTLRTLELTIRLYLQQRYITQLQADELIKIVKFLSK